MKRLGVLSTSLTAVVIAWSGPGCGTHQPGGMTGPTKNNRVESDAAPTPSLQSNDILAREPVANRVKVRHILIGWRDLADSYGRGMDPRAASRSREDADKLVEELYDRIQAGEPFEALMAEHSEDTGSAQSGLPFEVTPDAQLVLDFRRLSLRLEVGEVGIVLTEYGWHLIKRIA